MKTTAKPILTMATFLALLFSAVLPAATQSVRTLDILRHDLEIRIVPESRELEGFDRITFDAGERDAFSFYLGEFFEVKKAKLDGRRVKLERIEIDYPDEDAESPRADAEKEPAEDEHPENRVLYTLPDVSPGEHILDIEYAGIVDDTLTVPEGSRSGIPSETNGLIDAEGTYLSGYRTGWYPDGRDNFASFSIRVTTPAGFEAVTEGKRARAERGEKNTVTDWEIDYPSQHVTLMAARYIVREREVDGITLMAYFFPSEEDLIDTYLDASEDYIELYNKLIGPYPFSKFAVVENFFPTGYGMPSYTLLGRRIVRMPFIVKTSLGHEVAHNWWGNCVYPDHKNGNWCEGLTTYYADYRYEMEKSDSAAVTYRRDILVDYATHVTDSTDIALSTFESREDEISGVVGYGKCAMVFHMLRKQVGDEKFYRAMRNFYTRYRFVEADWKDIESVVEDVYGSPLDWFFGQWVFAPGAPRLTLEQVSLEEPEAGDGKYVVRVEIGNEGGFDLPGVPIEIAGPSTTRRITVPVTGERASFDWRLDERPLSLAVDPDVDLFRKLSAIEIPVTISRALAGDAPVIVLPSNATQDKLEAYRELADRLAPGSEGTEVAQDTSLSEEDTKSRAVFILGDLSENRAYDLFDLGGSTRLDGGEIEIDGIRYGEAGHAAFVTYADRLDPETTVCAIVGNSADAVRAAGYKVIYYGKYSYVTFLDGKKQVAGIFPPPPGPLVFSFEAGGVTDEKRGNEGE